MPYHGPRQRDPLLIAGAQGSRFPFENIGDLEGFADF